MVPLLQEIQEEQANAGYHNEEYYFSKEKQREFLNMFEHTNQTVAKKYLHRKSGILFYDTIANFQEEATHYPAEELIALCGEIILKQEQKNQELKKQLMRRSSGRYMLSALTKKTFKKFKKS